MVLLLVSFVGDGIVDVVTADGGWMVGTDSVSGGTASVASVGLLVITVTPVVLLGWNSGLHNIKAGFE